MKQYRTWTIGSHMTVFSVNSSSKKSHNLCNISRHLHITWPAACTGIYILPNKVKLTCVMILKNTYVERHIRVFTFHWQHVLHHFMLAVAWCNCIVSTICWLSSLFVCLHGNDVIFVLVCTEYHGSYIIAKLSNHKPGFSSYYYGTVSKALEQSMSLHGVLHKPSK